MSGFKGEFKRYHEEFESDPEYIANEISLKMVRAICRMMREKHMTHADLADRMGTSRAYVTKLLNGTPNVSLVTMVKIARALDMDLEVDFKETGRSDEALDRRTPELLQCDNFIGAIDRREVALERKARKKKAS